jgi:hypothetical protein
MQDGGETTSLSGAQASPTPGLPTPLTVAQFMLWTKRYGFQTAVLILLAQATGLFDQVIGQIGGMC